jgi:rRNA maturation endonuclease Nob1
MTKDEPKLELTEQDWRALVEAAISTRDVEIGCDECLAQVASYAELKLRGLPTPEALQRVEEHLNLCEECREEFEALADAMRGLI